MARTEAAANSAGEKEDPAALVRQVETELGLNEWWTPLSPRRPEHSGPRVTEDGLKVPDWYTDDETESQQWLVAQGVLFDA